MNSTTKKSSKSSTKKSLNPKKRSLPAKTAKSPDDDQKPSSTGFSDLPHELKRKIWLLTLSEPRVIHVTRNLPPGGNRSIVPPRGSHYSGPAIDYVVNPASYGVYHPAILSVDTESRAIALTKLTRIFGVYWNLEIDALYAEIKDNASEDVDLLAELRNGGHLKLFRNIAIDWMVWKWEVATEMMEFKATFGDKFAGYEHP